MDNTTYSRESVGHLLTEPGDNCWWCQVRPATTGEHKFKASDLARMMDDQGLVWLNTEGETRMLKGKGAIQRDRYGVVKFEKSLCAPCNNAASQPFDTAYERFSNYLAAHPQTYQDDGIPFQAVFGETWQDDLLNLARYYAKHFGCQMLRIGIGVPESLRAFLNGATDMPDCHMGLLTTDEIQRHPFGSGLSISPGVAFVDPARTELRGCVLASYVGAVGVRFEWNHQGFPDEHRSQFFHFPKPMINRLADDMAVFRGELKQ